MAIRRMNGMGPLGVLFSLDVFISAQFIKQDHFSNFAQIAVVLRMAFDTGERIFVRESCARFWSAMRQWPGQSRSTEKGDNETVTMAGFVPLALLAVLAATLYGPVYQQLTIMGVSSGVRHLW
ncbi:uncharacterized protein AFUA_3G05810 [Aspergillus fumigatus Af293]|uniref:Uncharacterized protein n=1 Tax=Aspergillus fumigatus (strain ATCC MYA-4609 / CBS 101355 / FGSC A1100 / Af293) TaxID=330879 RepID=Q4WWG8_ASPFU|nr:hypothetical protein AFUA_3G05810 [Aspergillus fumigatus Af293]EAL92985.1 hypothetical protein AFUA_3G05810 [Aspergillus fumigatus Af293]KEY83948.1 hypothetical protein BA78_8418 [Aspergillus fumigatus]